MAEPAVPSDSDIYDAYSRQDEELRERAHRLWMHSQALNISIGYAGVEGMVAINDKLPLKVQVKIQEKRLALLQRMDEGLQGHTGHTHTRLECRDGGAEIAPPKRQPLPSASSNIQRYIPFIIP
jgi:hypothetical protein